MICKAVGEAVALVAVLDRFLEAMRRISKDQALLPIERRLERRLQRAFRAQGVAFLRRFRSLRGFFPVQEAIHDRDIDGPFDGATGETEELFLRAMQEAARRALRAGVARGGAELGLTIRFDLANPRAVAYLQARGAARVAQINETTREQLRRIVTQAAEEGWSYDRTAQAIIERYREFAVGKPQQHIDSRAHGIAVTEVGEAYAQGNYMVGEDLQAAGFTMEKRWSTMGDDRVSEVCRGNEAAGWIPFAQAFPSGHMRPLAHPYCRCDLMMRRAQASTATEPVPPATPGAWPAVGPGIGTAARVRSKGGPERQPHVLGYTWQREELASVVDARAAGEAADGWVLHEQVFREKYLTRFKLKDDVEWTIGLWDAPEPSFNARVRGRAKRVLAMAKAWGRDYQQQAVAVLLPDKRGTGGRLVWDFGRKLSDEELDALLAGVREVNRDLADQVAREQGLESIVVGLTVKRYQAVEYWGANMADLQAAAQLLEEAMARAGLVVPRVRHQGGYTFRLLWQGVDY